MIRKIGTFAILLTLICSLTACGDNAKTDNTDNGTSVTQTDEDTKSSKKKYKNINADTKPVGVSDISAKLSNDDAYLFCKVYKNGGDIEESIIEVTLEVFDEDDNYIGEETLKTSRSLTDGDSETIKSYLGNCISDERHSDEFLSKCKVNVVAIRETDVTEAKEAEALAELMEEIEWKILYDEEYNSAIAMLEVAKEQYPNSKELKIFEAQMKDELAKKGISMDGSTITAETPEEAEAETE